MRRYFNVLLKKFVQIWIPKKIPMDAAALIFELRPFWNLTIKINDELIGFISGRFKRNLFFIEQIIRRLEKPLNVWLPNS